MKTLAKLFFITGILLIAIGAILYLLSATELHRWFQWLGKLPGDIRIEKENVRIYIPITTMLLLSILLTLLFNLIIRLFSR